MSDPVLSGVKVGDKLCVYSRLGDKRIFTVERVTPSGRVITGNNYTFNPDGSLRGDYNTWDRTRARPATEDDIAGIYRAGLVAKIGRFRAWDKLSAEDLKTVAAMVDRYEAKPR